MKTEILNLRIEGTLKSKLERNAIEQNRSLSCLIRNELEKSTSQNLVHHHEKELVHVIQSFYFMSVYSWIGILKTNPEHKFAISFLAVIRQCIREILEFERFPDNVKQGLENVLQNVTQCITNNNTLVYYTQSNQFDTDYHNISTYVLNVSQTKITENV